MVSNALYKPSSVRWTLYGSTTKEERAYLKEILSIPLNNKTTRIYYDQATGRTVQASNLTYTPLYPTQAEFTPNLFKNGVNSTNAMSNLYQVKSIALDVDYRKNPILKDRSPLEVYDYILELDIIGNIIPEPSYIEYGHQIRFIYVLDEPIACGTKKQSFDALNALIKRLCGFLNQEYDFNAEPQKLNSFYRYPGSINEKDGSTVRVKEISTYRYTFQEMMEYLDDLPEWYQKWKVKKVTATKKGKVLHIHTARTMLYERIKKFEEIAPTFNGNRYNLCYLYGQHLLQLDEYDIQKVFSLNNKLPHPLKEKEVSSKLGNLTKNKKYKHLKYKNTTINMMLGEEVFMTGRELERQAKIEAGTTRAQIADKHYLLFKEYRKQGMSLSEIAVKMNMSIDMMKRYSSRLRKENEQ